MLVLYDSNVKLVVGDCTLLVRGDYRHDFVFRGVSGNLLIISLYGTLL